MTRPAHIAAISLCLLGCSEGSAIQAPAGGAGGGNLACSDDPACPHPLGGFDAAVSVVAVYSPEVPMEVTDLAFHPTRPEELWLLRRQYAVSEACVVGREFEPACRTKDGSIAVVNDVGLETAYVTTYTDRNAWHFMRFPPAMAFGDNGTFATVGEARTGNFDDDGMDYMGPALWSSDLQGVVEGCEAQPRGCFPFQPPGKNGSHLDMLHETPFGMGIAHEAGNIYWTFNGQIGAVDRYDFHIDHGPGNEDHSDGEIARYVEGQLTRVEGVPSHMKFDPETALLYIADSGGQRVVALDTTSGTPAGSVTPNYDGLVNNRVMEGATVTELVPPGKLQAPSGLWIHEAVIYVTDNATSRIHAFSRTGEELRVVDTGYPAGSLAGITVGPDDKAYFVDKPTGFVYRIDVVDG